MSQLDELSRRSFLRRTGMTTVLGGAGHMRMNLATSRLLIRQALDKALDNIAAAAAIA